MLKEVISLQLQFEISDNDLTHFSQEAKRRLVEQAKSHTLEIMRESNRVEEMFRADGTSQEITESIVVQAISRNKIKRKKKPYIIAFKILSEVLIFIAGLLFVPEWFVKYNNVLNWAYIVFIFILITVAIGLTIVMHFKDGD